MTTYKIIFSIWTILYVFFATRVFMSAERSRLFSFINIFISSTLFSVIILTTSPFIVFLLENIIIFIFLIIEYFKNIRKLFSVIYVTYLVRFVFEFLMLITLKFLNINNNAPMFIYMSTAILTIIFNYTFKDYLINLVSTKNNDKIYRFKSVINLILILVIIFIHMPGQNIDITDNYIFYLIFTFIVFNLNITLFIEKSKTEDYIKNYQKIVEYTEFNEGLLTEYKSCIHEYKNKLIIIKGLAEENNHELHEYINSILNEKVSNNYHWLMDIKNIPIPGIKGLINYKLLKMKELKITAEVYVSDEVATLNPNQLDIKEKNNLYTILGVILDNAIEASLESKEKMISLQFFKDCENDNINIILANTFKSINLDQLEEKGYSSKGKNRGIGLYLVKEILRYSKNLEKETSIINNFFVQKIIIKNLK